MHVNEKSALLLEVMQRAPSKQADVIVIQYQTKEAKGQARCLLSPFIPVGEFSPSPLPERVQKHPIERLETRPNAVRAAPALGSKTGALAAFRLKIP